MENRFKECVDYLKLKRLIYNAADLAKMTGKQKSYISELMSGKRKISEQFVRTLVDLFPELSAEWLLSGEGKMIVGPYDRINHILHLEGISQREFEKGTGDLAIFIPGMYKNAQKNPGDPGILEQWVNYLLKRFPKYSKDWILYGEPPMYKANSDASNSLFRIPVYNLTATAGLVSVFQDHDINPSEFISVPNLPRVDGAIYVRGDSMVPLIKSGDIVIFKKVELSLDNIIWGQIYLLSYTFNQDDYTVVKYVRKSKKEGYIQLVSANPLFEPQDILSSSITALALVKASITFHTIE